MKIVSFNFISDIERWSDKKSSLFFNLAAAYSLFCEKGWITFLICNYRLGCMAKIKNYSLSSDVNRSLGKENIKYNIYAVIQLKDMEYICENESLRELGLPSLEKRKLWGIPDPRHVHKYLMGGAKTTALFFLLLVAWPSSAPLSPRVSY